LRLRTQWLAMTIEKNPLLSPFMKGRNSIIVLLFCCRQGDCVRKAEFWAGANSPFSSPFVKGGKAGGYRLFLPASFPLAERRRYLVTNSELHSHLSPLPQGARKHRRDTGFCRCGGLRMTILLCVLCTRLFYDRDRDCHALRLRTQWLALTIEKNLLLSPPYRSTGQALYERER
jgi:hypothetical protein